MTLPNRRPCLLVGYGRCLTSISAQIRPYQRRTSVTHGQRNAKPAAILPSADRYRPLTGTELGPIPLDDKGTMVWTTCPELSRGRALTRPSNPRPLDRKSDAQPVAPSRHKFIAPPQKGSLKRIDRRRMMSCTSGQSAATSNSSTLLREQAILAEIVHLKPNSITLVGSKLVADRNPCSFQPASVMEFGFYRQH